MDLFTYYDQNRKNKALDIIYWGMPKYLSSKHRLHRLFFKKCDSEILAYQDCIEDNNW